MAHAATEITWFTSTGITDWDGSTVLAGGSVVQLLIATEASEAVVGGEVLSSPAFFANPDWTAASETLVASTTIDSGAVPPGFGAFQVPKTRYDNVTPGDLLFIRAFNGAIGDAATATYWGQSSVLGLAGDADASPPPAPNALDWKNGTTPFLVPEPSTILLALVGFAMLLRKVRK
jgi:hypothetical protein